MSLWGKGVYKVTKGRLMHVNQLKENDFVLRGVKC